MEKNLAIVIPAFKPDFLKKSLQSIENQTNKNFQVYICDDGSPYDLWKIVQPFVEKNGWIYNRFDQNLGGKNLILHWNRSVKLSLEPWIWLFSDDDEMSQDCVEAFYSKLKTNRSSVLKFSFALIDEFSNVLEINHSNEINLTGFNFGRLRFERKILTSAVEFIFSRLSFEREGGFINFPAGWCSDDASWIAFSEPEEIAKIENGMVFWRLSQVNISSLAGPYIKAKTQAAVQYILWFNNRYKSQIDSTLFGEQIIWLRLQIEQIQFKIPMFKAIRICHLLSPRGVKSWLRTFNEIYARSYVSSSIKRGENSAGFREWLAKLLPKF